jgi:hypothetical protein
MVRKPRAGRKLLVASIGVATMSYVVTTSGCSTAVGNLAYPDSSGSSGGGGIDTGPTKPGGGSGSGSGSGSGGGPPAYMPDARADDSGDGPIMGPVGNLMVVPTDASEVDSTEDSATDATSADSSADSPADSPTDASVTFDVFDDFPIANLIVPPFDAGSTE